MKDISNDDSVPSVSMQLGIGTPSEVHEFGQVSGDDDLGGIDSYDINSDSNSSHHDQSEGSCSHKCVALQGNLQSITRVDAPIKWLVDACVHMNLFPAELQQTHHDEAIANWLNRDVKYSTAERYKTGGGITDTQFWPNILKEIQQRNVLSHQSSTQMVFTDFGSEFFLQGLLCALLGDFRLVVGIEINMETFENSVNLAKWLTERAHKEGIFISNIQLHQGNFLKHDAILGITAQSTIVYANNVVFENETNVALVALWRKYLPAGATIVVFDEKAILGSESTRLSRKTHEKIQWTQSITTMKTSVSWKPGFQYSIHVWQVSPVYTKLRDWAAHAKFGDLVGWANFNGRACIIDGAKRYSLQPQHFEVFLNLSSLTRELNSALQRGTNSIFLAVTTSNIDYIHARNQLSEILQETSTCVNLNFVCVVDCSDKHPVLSILLQEMQKMKGRQGVFSVLSLFKLRTHRRAV
jgi:hypothetical protein